MTETSPSSTAVPATGATAHRYPDNPMPALWALVLGFFMILVDSTIVTVATPVIMEKLGADVNSVIWVTSAYLLAYAVPLLITGRLGDRFGPKRMYLTGLTIFTLASLWCGLTSTIGALIAARVVQGFGASLMTPQTMAVITRTFRPDRRGQAMALWGATAGVAMIVGPILGGVLVDGPGWEWIFFINVPVGVLAFWLAHRRVPRLETHSHTFDWVGVALSAVGMFLLVFGIQEGETYDWGTITGVISVPLLIGLGIAVMLAFVLWQARNRREPLVPLGLFRDRNFSLSNLAVFTVGFCVTSMGFPFMLYTQAVRGWTPTQSAMLMIPMALFSGGLAPVVGRLTDRVHPRLLAPVGMAVVALSLFGLGLVLHHADTPVWQILVLMGVMGLGQAFMWGPLATTANRNLPMNQAGAGAGVYNTTRQLGAVLGSAAIAVFIESRISVNLSMPAGAQGQFSNMAGSGAAMPPQIAEHFATAMGQTLWLPAAVLLVGALAPLFFEAPRHLAGPGARVEPKVAPATMDG